MTEIPSVRNAEEMDGSSRGDRQEVPRGPWSPHGVVLMVSNNGYWLDSVGPVLANEVALKV